MLSSLAQVAKFIYFPYRELSESMVGSRLSPPARWVDIINHTAFYLLNFPFLNCVSIFLCLGIGIHMVSFILLVSLKTLEFVLCIYKHTRVYAYLKLHGFRCAIFFTRRRVSYCDKLWMWMMWYPYKDNLIWNHKFIRHVLPIEIMKSSISYEWFRRIRGLFYSGFEWSVYICVLKHRFRGVRPWY